jgi:hypothetical protein
MSQLTPVHTPSFHFLKIHLNIIPNLMYLFRCLGCTEVSVQVQGYICEYFVTKISFHGELLAPRPTPKLEDHPLSAVPDCLFNIFAATLHIGGCSSIHNLRMHHAVVTLTTYHWQDSTHTTLISELRLGSDRF